MRTKKLISMIVSLCLIVSLLLASANYVEVISADTTSQEENLRLWYDKPVSRSTVIGSAGAFSTTTEDNYWQQLTLPIGNSYMGANIYGEIGREQLTFNHKTLWNGGPSTRRPNYNGGNIGTVVYNGRTITMSEAFRTVQNLFLQGNSNEATTLSRKLVGMQDGYGAYQSFGDIILDFGLDQARAANYTRDLELNTGIANVDFQLDGTTYHREYFISYPDQVLAMKLTAAGSNKLSFDVSFPIDNAENVASRNLGKTVQTTVANHMITVAGTMQDNQLKLNGKLKVADTDGTVAANGDKLRVANATSVVIYVSADTDYLNDYPAYRTGETDAQLDASVRSTIDRAVSKTYQTLKADHIADHSGIFNRLHLDLGQNVPTLPTDRLLANYKAGTASAAEQRALEVLQFQYGRYLTIASSRAGDLPANLQGVWQNRVGDANRVPWGSDYHMNVNLQMNYWPTYVTNMAECAIPIVDYVNSLMEPGSVTAGTYFGVSQGFTAHTQNTPFGWTCPGWSFDWGWSPAALPWIIQNCWEYYEYTKDVDYMRTRLYPMMKSAIAVYDEILKWDANTGRYVSVPTYSPEHGPVAMGNTYEQSLIWQLYEDTIIAAETLNVDQAKVTAWKDKQSKLNPIAVGASGQIKEWPNETTLGSMGSRGHRHMSHLLGLYPGDLISVDNPQYMDAAKVSLLERGDTSTGWGMGQRINSWARTGDGNQSHKLIKNLFRDGIYPNLWDSHAPFQIDGNFGLTSGIAEMLIQSNMGYINILPALSDEWPDGEVNGLVARGNFEVDIRWHDGIADQVKILSKKGGECTVQYKNIAFATIRDNSGNAVPFTVVNNDRVTFHTAVNSEYEVTNLQKLDRPFNVRALMRSDGNVSLTWNGAADTAFHIYRKANGSAYTQIASGVQEMQYTDTTASLSWQDIYYQIEAVNGTIVSDRSEAAPVIRYDMAAPAGVIDDRDSRVQFSSGWGLWNDSSHMNGTIKFIERSVKGDSVSLVFHGDGIEVITPKNPNFGTMEVFIDGISQGIVDLYATSSLKKQSLYKNTGLTKDIHIIELVSTGAKNPASSSTKLEFDAFIVSDSTNTANAAPAGIIDDRDSYVEFSPGWGLWNDSSHINGTIKFIERSSQGDSVSLVFQGDGIEVITPKNPNFGTMEVFIDGISQGIVDLYAASSLKQQSIYKNISLTKGIHTIRLVSTGAKNPASSSTKLEFDAFIVYDA